MSGTGPSRTPVDLPATGAVPWQYVARSSRPHIHPVTTPAGHVLTRDSPPDHPWHHALWFTIKFVDGDNFWEQVEPFGRLRHHVDPDVSGAVLSGGIDWVRPESDEVALRQTVRISAVDPPEPESTSVDVHITLTAERDVALDRTPFTTWGGYGGLAFRGRPNLVDSTITLADGSAHERVLGVRSPWFDLSGFLGPERHPVGVTMLDGTTPGGTVPWYGSTRSSTYGEEGWSNFFNAAFLWDGPMALSAAAPMTFSYRVIAHDGIADADRIAAQARRYAEPRADR